MNTKPTSGSAQTAESLIGKEIPYAEYVELVGKKEDIPTATAANVLEQMMKLKRELDAETELILTETRMRLDAAQARFQLAVMAL